MAARIATVGVAAALAWLFLAGVASAAPAGAADPPPTVTTPTAVASPTAVTAVTANLAWPTLPWCWPWCRPWPPRTWPPRPWPGPDCPACDLTVRAPGLDGPVDPPPVVAIPDVVTQPPAG